MKKIHSFMKIASLFMVVVMLSTVVGITGVMAEEVAVINVTNGTAYTDFTSAWDGSLLIAATINKPEGVSASVKVVADDGSTIADIPVDNALVNGTDSAMHLVVSKNNGTYKLYKNSDVVIKGTIAKAPAKKAAKVGFTAENGTISLSKVTIFDYMEKRAMTDTLYTDDFSAMADTTRIGTTKSFNGYCDDWYLENVWASTESGWDYSLNGSTKEYFNTKIDGTNGLKYIDRSGNNSLRHMIKNGGMEENFELSYVINFPGSKNYSGGFRLFITNDNGEEINLIKSPAVIDAGNYQYRVQLNDDTATSLFDTNTLPTDKDITFTVNVDLAAQMYTVKCRYDETIRETASPIKLPENIDSVESYGFAKDRIVESEDYSWLFIKSAAVKGRPERGVTELFKEDFNDGITGWNEVGGNEWSSLNINSATYEGHKSLLVERKKAINIVAATNTGAGVTHYGTLNADGTLTEDSGAVGGTGPSKAHSAVYTLPNAISTTQDLYVEFEARLGNKSWKWNGTAYESPRDVAYVSLGNDTAGLNAPEYMDYMLSGGAIQSFGGAEAYAATDELLMPKEYYQWRSNGPSAEWVTSTINNDGNNRITYKTVGSVEGKERTISYDKDETNPQTFNTITVSINRDNGGAVYIDNIRIYTVNNDAVESDNFSENVMKVLAQPTELYGNEFAIGNIPALESGANLASISIYNNSGNTTKSACVIAALYKKEGSTLSLVDCAFETAFLENAGANSVVFSNPVEMPADFSNGGYTVKVFLFDGIANIIPLQLPMEYIAQ